MLKWMSSALQKIKGTMESKIYYVSPRNLKEMLSQPVQPILLDVRECEELTGELGVIPGVINIPVGDLPERISELEPHLDREIVVVCRSGKRAVTGARVLKMANFKKVAVLEGGMIAWRKNHF